MPPAVGLAIAGVGGLVGAKMGANAANTSARLQTDSTNRAAELQSKATADALGFQKEQFEYGKQQMQPYLRMGEQSLGTLGGMMGFNGGGAPMTGPALAGGAQGTLGTMGGYQPPEMVTIASPDGSSTRQVPKAMAQHYLSRGGKVVG
jgi:hypothetical protein